MDLRELLTEQENDLLTEEAHMADWDEDEDIVDPDADWYFDPDSEEDEAYALDDDVSEELEEKDSEDMEESHDETTDDGLLVRLHKNS